MQQQFQGIGYGRVPKAHDGKFAPKCIYITLQELDFLNAVSFNTTQPNTIASPEGYLVNLGVPIPSLPATQFAGYLGQMVTVDLSAGMRAQGMSWLSSVYIDNSNNAGVCIIRNRATGLQVCAAPFTQGVYPLVLPEGSVFNFDVAVIDSYGSAFNNFPSFDLYPDSTGGGAGGTFFGINVESGALRMQFTDAAMPPCVWNTRNTLTGTWWNYSGTITTAQTWQFVLTGNPFRKAILIANPIAATEPLYFDNTNFGDTLVINGATFNKFGIPLAPGEKWLEKIPAVGQNTLRLASSTAGHAYIVRELQ